MFASPPPLREKIPTVSPPVEEVVLIALAKDPSQRFKTVQAFVNALEQAIRLERSTGQAILSADISASPWADTVRSETSSHVDEGASTVGMEHAKETPEGQIAVAGSRNGKLGLWRVWGISKRQVLAMILGIILYGAANYPLNYLYSQDSSLVVTSISVFNTSIDSGIIISMSIVLLIPLFFGTVFGPWVGLITVLAGTYLGALLAGYSAPSDYYGASWTWFAGQLMIGFIAGLALLKTQGRYNTGSAIAYAVAFCAVGVLVGTAFATFADIWVSGITTDEAWNSFLSLAQPAALDLILLPLLLFVYNTVAGRLKVVQFSNRA
jgi:energy-coupling factor transport system substrate-specific component